MAAPDLQRCAYSVECFLNALRLVDGPERTAIEEWLVRWLSGPTHQKGDCVIYRQSALECYSGNRVVKNFPLPQVTQPRTLWCNGEKLSAIDAEEYVRRGNLVMLGTAGLLLTLPGAAAAETAGGRQSTKEKSSNNKAMSLLNGGLY